MTEPEIKTIRSFIAVEINAEVRDAMFRVQARLRRVYSDVGWVKPENMHLTLLFLGNIFENQVPEIGQKLDQIALKVPPFKFEVMDVGTFGEPRAPRVIWVGLNEQDDHLRTIYQFMDREVNAMGIRTEKRPFRPHLTLGRVRSQRGVDALTSQLLSVKNTNFGCVEVRRLLLMQSHLEAQGSQYTIRHESILKGT